SGSHPRPAPATPESEVPARSQTRSTSSSAWTPTAILTPWPPWTPARAGVLHERQIPADAAGYARALALVAEHYPVPRAWAVEGSGACGAGLARFLAAQAERVIEIDRPERRGERTRAKSDALDAVRAARTARGRERQ